MALAPVFDVKITLYFKVMDSDMYGGPGSVGYATQAFDHVTALENADDAMAERCRGDMATMLGVCPENLEFITYEEYEESTGEDADDE